MNIIIKFGIFEYIFFSYPAYHPMMTLVRRKHGTTQHEFWLIYPCTTTAFAKEYS